jgi:hypothetical protein
MRYTVGDIAHHSQYSESTIRRDMRSGKLKTIDITTLHAGTHYLADDVAIIEWLRTRKTLRDQGRVWLAELVKAATTPLTRHQINILKSLPGWDRFMAEGKEG